MGTSRRPRPARLASKLRQIRTRLGLTQEQLGELLTTRKSPVYPGHVSEFERGKREPSLLALLSYARTAGLPLELLVDDKLEVPASLPGPGKRFTKP
ncbi:MAG: Helix-turn-helix domain [Blastocatellia bacterium]|jgi:transcriptional regulator with XRE-family HTH domain|nr:Helix-turn-helix domain [Blastocatellia bacterium]